MSSAGKKLHGRNPLACWLASMNFNRVAGQLLMLLDSHVWNIVSRLLVQFSLANWNIVKEKDLKIASNFLVVRFASVSSSEGPYVSIQTVGGCCKSQGHLRLIYMTENFWHGSDKNGMIPRRVALIRCLLVLSGVKECFGVGKRLNILASEQCSFLVGMRRFY